MDYQIVHAIEGRLRLRISLLAANDGFAAKLQPLIEAIAFVTSVRVSPPAQSLIVTYKYKKPAQAVLLQTIEAAIAQAALPEETDDQPNPESPPEPIAQNSVEIPLETVSSAQPVAQPFAQATGVQPAADCPIAPDAPAASVAEQAKVEQPKVEQAKAEQAEVTSCSVARSRRF